MDATWHGVTLQFPWRTRCAFPRFRQRAAFVQASRPHAPAVSHRHRRGGRGALGAATWCHTSILWRPSRGRLPSRRGSPCP
eukprot:11227595-Lingulodinium_polyedra.AAC.1